MKIKSFYLFALLFLFGCTVDNNHGIITLPVPERVNGQTDVIGLKCDPIPVVRVGFIGLGMRGHGAVNRFMIFDDIEVKAISDFEPFNLARVQEILTSKGHPEAAVYTGNDGWKELCQRDDIDLIYICTDWYSHAEIAVYAMQQGKHVAVEGPAATTVEECWQLVDTAEKTRKHCMLLENCCYDDFVLATLNMAQQGLFGEIVHTEGAYIHDLRPLLFSERTRTGEEYVPGVGVVEQLERLAPTGYWEKWRLKFNTEHTGNPYPTHGFGPACQVLNIHRGDKMDYLVSVSSNQFGMTEYAKEKFGKNSPEAQTEYAKGDMSTTLLKTHKGKTIMLQHNATNTRPYNRIHMINGTKGLAQLFPRKQIMTASMGYLSTAKMDSVLAHYQHTFQKQMGEAARNMGAIAHGGMDVIMDYRLLYCLKNGLPLDIDVYDAAEWSCIVELSELSARNKGATIEVPDFTRGAWNKQKGLVFAE